ncbi:MAG: cation:proton antiporter [Gemmiger sp.]|nr:cation:proton antiporter [Gemmiger sp.]
MYSVFRDLAILIVFAKFFGLLARKLGAPQVVGEIMAGLLIGPCLLNLVQTTDTITTFAEIGVVLLMFSTGLGTNLKELLKAGPVSLLIACVGVAVPLVGGTLLYGAFYGLGAIGSPTFFKALFIGTIMTATSVSITVATLQEMGKLKGYLGTTIVSAAVIDDVIGIVVLTCVIGAGAEGSGNGIVGVLVSTVLFFLVSIGAGAVIYFVMRWLDKRNPHTQRIPIISMAFCFIMAYLAEQYFGIADITGAYIAGVVLCSIDDAPYVERRVDISNYMLFGPVFFASIGLKTDISGVTPTILLFSVCFILVALATKVIGCGLSAKLCRFSWADSLKVGVGMMTRGEVALIVAQKGLAVGLIEPVYFTAVILLILVSSISTPLVLKALFSRDKTPQAPEPAAV